MREKVHLLACAQVVFFAVSLVELLPGGSPGRVFPWSGFCWACLPPGVVCAWAVPMEVVPSGVFLPGRASFLRKWSRRVCFCRACLFPPEVVALEVPPAGGVWRLEEGVGRWNRPVCRLELAGLRAGSSFVAKKRKL